MIPQNFWETRKDTWYHKTYEECREIGKIKIHLWTIWLLVHGPWTWKKKDKVQVPQRNEMLSSYCTAVAFISKNEEYNPEENIPNGRYLKNLILQKVVKQ